MEIKSPGKPQPRDCWVHAVLPKIGCSSPIRTAASLIVLRDVKEPKGRDRPQARVSQLGGTTITTRWKCTRPSVALLKYSEDEVSKPCKNLEHDFRLVKKLLTWMNETFITRVSRCWALGERYIVWAVCVVKVSDRLRPLRSTRLRVIVLIILSNKINCVDDKDIVCVRSCRSKYLTVK